MLYSLVVTAKTYVIFCISPYLQCTTIGQDRPRYDLFTFLKIYKIEIHTKSNLVDATLILGEVDNHTAPTSKSHNSC